MTTKQEREAAERRETERSRSIAQQGREQRIATQKAQSIRAQADQPQAEAPVTDEDKRSRYQEIRDTAADVLQKFNELQISFDEANVGDKVHQAKVALQTLYESAVAVLKGAGMGGKPGEQPPLEDIGEEPTVEDKPEGAEAPPATEPPPPAEVVEGRSNPEKHPA
jgi:hypothetical protein